MSLIKCSDCGKKISDKALVCSNCGCPNENIVALYDEKFESWYKLSNEQQEELFKEFLNETEQKLEKYGVNILKSIIFGFIITFPFALLSGSFKVFIIVILCHCFGFVIASLIYTTAINRKIEEEFISWLRNTKHIYKVRE